MTAKRIGSKMLEVHSLVGLWPGKTAHWYGKREARRWRWSRWYALFARCVAAGLIRSETDGRGYTVYFPARD